MLIDKEELSNESNILSFSYDLSDYFIITCSYNFNLLLFGFSLAHFYFCSIGISSAFYR